MNNVVFNRETLQVQNINTIPLPFQFQVLTSFPITLSKSIQFETNQLIQKTTPENLPLYKDEITIDEITGEESYIETTAPQKVTAYEPVTNVYKIVIGEEMVEQINELGETILVPVPIYNEIVTISENPIAWDKLEPIMIDEVVSRTITFPDQYMNFDYYEVLEAKKQSINNNNLLKIVDFDEDFLDSNLILNNCSIGDGVLILYPNSTVTTHPIQLSKTTNMFQIYLESQPNITISISGDNGLTFTDFDSKGKAKLSIPTDKVIINFKNTAINNREIYCYALLA